MNDFVKGFETKMTKTISVLRQDYAAIRAGRANPALLDKVTVMYYDVPTPINQVGSVSVTEARTLTITPWDRTVLKAIEKAIMASEIGINPQNDGSVIRLVFPPLTEERRKDLCKQIAKMGEDSKVAIRSIRRDANEKLKAQKKELPEDTIKDIEKQVQDITDKYCKEIDQISAVKEKEIMEV
ncbi:MAG: ribosome recycling factor [Oscillospiraceae bacterium]|jgi:ribosome recycling factor|nr:ribosome recycling factor [Oscillospiraceae bacterium]